MLSAIIKRNIKIAGWLVALLVFWIGGACRAEADEVSPYRKFQDLERDWLVYNKADKQYVPFLPGFNKGSRHVHLIIADSLRGKHIGINGQADVFLFINNKLSFQFTKGNWHFMAIDSLVKIWGIPFTISYYHANQPITHLPSAGIYDMEHRVVVSSGALNSSVSQAAVTSYPMRYRGMEKSWLTVGSILLLFSIAISSNRSKRLLSLSYLTRNLWSFYKGKNQQKRVELLPTIQRGVYYSVGMAYIVMLTGTYAEYFPLYNFFEPPSGMLSWLITMFQISTLVFLYLFLRSFIYFLLARLYNDRQIFPVHMQEFIVSSEVIITLLMAGGVLINAFSSYYTRQYIGILVYACYFSLVVQAAIICFRINRQTMYKNVYLIAYLCASELIPLLITLKLFIEL